jgi:hypothetical protein
MAARDLAPPCGPTGDEAECNCGCSGYDDRCRYYTWVYENMTGQVKMHYCCKIPGR